MTAEEAPLARAAALVAGLRPDWRGDPEGFYQRRSEVLDLLRRAAAAPGRTRDKPRCRWPDAPTETRTRTCPVNGLRKPLDGLRALPARVVAASA